MRAKQSDTTPLQQLRRLVSTGETTQSEIARATGVDQSQVSRILAGHAKRPSKNVLRLCKYAEARMRVPISNVDALDPAVIRTIAEVTGNTRAGNTAVRDLLRCVARIKNLSGRNQ